MIFSQKKNSFNLKFFFFLIFLSIFITVIYILFFSYNSTTIDLTATSSKETIKNTILENDKKKKDKISFIEKNIQLNADNITFSGKSKDNSPYTIFASNAQKIDDENFRILNSKSLINTKFGLVKIESQEANFNKTINQIIFEDRIKLLLNDSIFSSDNLIIDLLNKKIDAKDNIEVKSQFFQIKSNQLESEDEYHIIRFKGNVKTNIILN